MKPGRRHQDGKSREPAATSRPEAGNAAPEHPRAERELQHETRSLEAINAVGDAVHRSLDFETIAQRAIEAIMAYTPFTCVSIQRVNRRDSTLDLVAQKGFSDAVVQARRRMPIEGSFVGTAVKEKRVVSTDDLRLESKGVKQMREALIREGFRSVVTVPLIQQDRVLGTLTLVQMGDYLLNEQERKTLLAIGKTVALAWANAEYVNRIEAEVGERRLAEERLREGEIRYEMATAAARIGVWDWNLETGEFYLDRNVKGLLGYDDLEIPNDMEAWSSFVHPEDRGRTAELARLHIEGATPEYVCEHRMLHRDGSVRWFLARGHAIRDDEGRALRLIGTDADITERKQLEDDRQALEKQIIHGEKLKSLGILAGGIAHDFNNLLTGVLGNAGLALMQASEESPLRQPLEQIQKAAQRAAELTRQLLAYSGKGALVLRSLDLSRLVEEMTELLRVSISKKTELRYDFAPGLPSVEGDPGQLRQVIMNLITNASEALGGDPGVITVRTGVMPSGGTAGRVWFEVVDTGCGMGREIQSRIFDPFYTTKFTGRGLGLAAVQGIVRGHGGTIEVESERGAGTKVRVLLPGTERPADRLEEPVADELEEIGAGTVLVVDDEEGVRVLARTVLERAGFEVLTANDGREGIEVFRQRSDEIRVVLLDLTMPRMDGEEALREIRRIREDTRVVLSSGYGTGQTLDRFRDVASFLEKPYRPQALLDKVRQALES